MSDEPNIDKRRKWEPWQLKLMDEYPLKGGPYVAGLTGMTQTQVANKAQALGMTRCRQDGRRLYGSKHVGLFGLHDTEIDILRAIAQGKGVKHAARELGLSPHTVSDSLKACFRKLDVTGQVAAVLKAERAGLLEGVNP